MKTKIFKWCILYLLSSTTSQAKDIKETKLYDSFSGTILQHSNQLFLKRCDVGTYEYPLHFNHAHDHAEIKRYLREYPKFWVNIRGNVYEEKERYYLTVEEVSDVHSNQSCHLLGLLEDWDLSDKYLTHHLFTE